MKNKIKRNIERVNRFVVKKILKKEYPLSMIDKKEYLKYVKEEFYDAWTDPRVLELLRVDSLASGKVKLPSDLTYAEVLELNTRIKFMIQRSLAAQTLLHLAVYKMEDEASVDMLLKRKYIRNQQTRRKALLLDETIGFYKEVGCNDANIKLFDDVREKKVELKPINERADAEIRRKTIEQLTKLDGCMEVGYLQINVALKERNLNTALRKFENKYGK